MRGWLLIPLLAVTASAQHRSGVYVTELGRNVLTRTDELVEAEIVKVQKRFRGITTVRMRIKRRYIGVEEQRDVNVLFIEDFMAPDAFGATLETSRVRPDTPGIAASRGQKGSKEGTRTDVETSDAPGSGAKQGRGIRLREGEQGLFFLQKQRTSYRLIAAVTVADRLYEVKLKRMQEVLELERESTFDRKVETIRRYYMRGLEAKVLWLRANSAREMVSLARRFPDLFGPTDVRRLASLRAKERDPQVRALLARAIRTLDPQLRVLLNEEQAQVRDQRLVTELEQHHERIRKIRNAELRAAELRVLARNYGAAAGGLLALYLKDPDPVVRATAALALVQVGGTSAREPVRKALSRERDERTARAMIIAAGELIDKEAVPILARKSGNPKLLKDTVQALARIGTESAQLVLRGIVKDADDESAAQIRKWIAELAQDRK